MIIKELIRLMKDISIKEIPENENPNKIANIVEKKPFLDGQLNDRGSKILIPQQYSKDYQ